LKLSFRVKINSYYKTNDVVKNTSCRRAVVDLETFYHKVAKAVAREREREIEMGVVTGD
jgi:hypothetical protein